MTVATTTAAAAFARRSRISKTRWPISDRPPALQCADQRDLVGVLEIATDGQSAGDTTDDRDAVLEAFGEVHRGRLALKGRVRRQDDLGERRTIALCVIGTREELADLQAVGADPIDR